MKYKAIFLDFYGTLVHEDDDILPLIYEQVQATAQVNCTHKEIGGYWWAAFSHMFRNSYGQSFQTQREIGLTSLVKTIEHFESSCIAEEIIQIQFEHWMKPCIYADTAPFLQQLTGVPVYVLSNIDSSDINAAMDYHKMNYTAVITSEDVRSYKPRPEMFREAQRMSQLTPNEVIHIGDSIISDVQGAQQLDIPTIWLNRLNKQLPEGIHPDYICENLDEVAHYLFQGS